MESKKKRIEKKFMMTLSEVMQYLEENPDQGLCFECFALTDNQLQNLKGEWFFICGTCQREMERGWRCSSGFDKGYHYHKNQLH